MDFMLIMMQVLHTLKAIFDFSLTSFLRAVNRHHTPIDLVEIQIKKDTKAVDFLLLWFLIYNGQLRSSWNIGSQIIRKLDQPSCLGSKWVMEVWDWWQWPGKLWQQGNRCSVIVIMWQIFSSNWCIDVPC